MADAGWMCVWSPRVPSIVHVLPPGDIIEHSISQRCQCNPRKQLNCEGPHVQGVIYAHHAHDGRS